MEILLVEDSADDVDLTLHAFKKARIGNHVNVVTDGAEALDYLFCRAKYSERDAAKGPHLVLLDLNLPKINGLEVLQRVKADKRTAKLPVIVLTMSHEKEIVAECLRLGADNYIVKPVSFQRLSAVTPQLNLNWALLKLMDTKPQKVLV